jgi:hypothetical protein
MTWRGAEQLPRLSARRREDMLRARRIIGWSRVAQAYAKLRGLFGGCMKGKTMYVVPFVMGPIGSPLAKVGVQLTDSVYVAVSMGIMTRMGNVAWKLGARRGGGVDGRDGMSRSLRADCTRWRIAIRSGGISAISRWIIRSGVWQRVWRERAAGEEMSWRCGSPVFWAASRGGWRSTCC